MKKGPPADYDAITSQAIAAVQAGLKAGEKAMEVEVKLVDITIRPWSCAFVCVHIGAHVGVSGLALCG